MKYENRSGTYTGPVPWWTFTGIIDHKAICRQLDEFKKIGIEEFFVYPNFGLVKPDFLSEEWFECIGMVLEECVKRGMRFWIYDELNWPSGSAGGVIARDYPQFRMKSIFRDEKVVASGEEFTFSADGDILWRGVLDESNSLIKTASPGEVYTNSTAASVKAVQLKLHLIEEFFFHSMGTESTWNQPGTIDALNPAAVKCWMDLIHERYREHFESSFGTVIKGFFFDEPTMVSALKYTADVPWTPDLEEAFEKRYNYPLRERYWQLFYDTKADGVNQFRYAFWRFCGERFATAFFKPMYDWCEKYGMQLTGHGWPEEPACQRLMLNMCGDLHYQQHYMHVPGTDLLGAENCFSEKAYLCPHREKWARNMIYSFKHPQSSGRYDGTRRIMCEASGIRKFNSTLAEQRWVFDSMIALGVNMINSAFANSLAGFRKFACSTESVAPSYKYIDKMIEYQTRACDFNVCSRLKTDIAVLNPVSTKFALTDITPDTSIRQETTPLPEGGDCAEPMLQVLDRLTRTHRDFELLFEEVLVNGRVENGKLILPETEFSLIILPQALVLDEKVHAKLAEFTASGGKLIAVGDAPQKILFSDSKAPAAMRSGGVDCFAVLDHEAADFGEKFSQAVEAVSPALYTLSGEGADTVLTQLRSEGDWYGLMLCNATAGEKTVRLTDKLPATRAIFDPATGEFFRPEADGTIVIAEWQSLIIDFSVPQEGLPDVAYAPWYAGSKRSVMELSPVWQVNGKFTNCANYPKEAKHAGEYIEIPEAELLTFTLDPDNEPEIEMRGSFNIDGEIPSDLRLRICTESFRDLTVNGSPVSGFYNEKIFDEGNYAVPIAPFCRQGKNTFTVKLTIAGHLKKRYGISIHFSGLLKVLEAPVLAGHFSWHGDTVMPPPETVTAGDLCTQGFRHFSGELNLKQTFDCTKEGLKAEFLTFGAAETIIAAKLNGCDLGVKVWKSGSFKIPSGVLKECGNVLEVTIVSALGNTYQQSWCGGKEIQKPFTLPEARLETVC